MNLMIFTPGLIKSAIGRMACLVTEVLVSQGHNVTIVRTESSDLLKETPHAFPCDVILWTENSKISALASKADSYVYQIGNNYSYHCGGLEWIKALPGVVCLHDYFLGHLFYEWASKQSVADAEEILVQHYGKRYQDYFCYTDSASFIDETRNVMPMTEWVAAQATGVVVHSAWDKDRLINSCPGPVAVIPLAYAAPNFCGVSRKVDFAKLSMTVITVGHVNANKRAYSVIEAIASSVELKHKVEYRLVGPIESLVADELMARARACGVRLIIKGEVSDVDLAQELVNADVACCLRWPTLEAASASTIEAMLCGKPTLVINTGFYSELPNESVVKISLEEEIESIRDALEKLLIDVEYRNKIGELARVHAEALFSPQSYAKDLVRFCEDSIGFNVLRQALSSTLAKSANWSDRGTQINLSKGDRGLISKVFGIDVRTDNHFVSRNRSRSKKVLFGTAEKLYAILSSKDSYVKKIVKKFPFSRKLFYWYQSNLILNTTELLESRSLHVVYCKSNNAENIPHVDIVIEK